MKLQVVQNSAVRAIYGVSKSDHITELRKELHWLPVDQRIIYKVLLLTFKAIHGLAPVYIRELIQVYTPVRPLRSTVDTTLLVRKKFRLKTYGFRAFSVQAPLHWNKLPRNVRETEDIRDFKVKLKTHLFKKSYY